MKGFWKMSGFVVLFCNGIMCPFVSKKKRFLEDGLETPARVMLKF